MEREILIVLLSQVPLALYTIVSGILKHRSDMRVSDAKTAEMLGGALSGAGETLEEAWREIRNLKRELRRWTLYASRLAEQAHAAGLPPIPFPPESDPKIQV